MTSALGIARMIKIYQRSINVHGKILQYVDSSECQKQLDLQSETPSSLYHQRRLGHFVYNKLPINITPVKQILNDYMGFSKGWATDHT